MSPVGNIGRRGHQFPYFCICCDLICASCFVPANPSREFSGSLGNVAWKERVDGWKMKDKGAIPMTNGTSIAPSEGRGVGDIDASTDYNMEDALL
jgi:cellulose synthase A